MSDSVSTWKKFLAEWLTIFISISAAFALDRWNDARKENEMEVKSIHALIQEVQSDTTGLSDAIRRSLLGFDRQFNNNFGSFALIRIQIYPALMPFDDPITYRKP